MEHDDEWHSGGITEDEIEMELFVPDNGEIKSSTPPLPTTSIHPVDRVVTIADTTPNTTASSSSTTPPLPTVNLHFDYDFAL